jgi:surface protein
MRCIFKNCSKLTNLNLNNFNTENVNNMSYMFNQCSNLINLDISNFKTQIIIDISNMLNEFLN